VIASLLLEIAALEGAELDGCLQWLLLLRDCSDRPPLSKISFVTDGD
jgi:hypothetical protein